METKEEISKSKETVKFASEHDSLNESVDHEKIDRNCAQQAAKLKATPAIFKRRQATKHLEVQSPTDHIFSPCSQKLLHKKRTEMPKEYD